MGRRVSVSVGVGPITAVPGLQSLVRFGGVPGAVGGYSLSDRKTALFYMCDGTYFKAEPRFRNNQRLESAVTDYEQLHTQRRPNPKIGTHADPTSVRPSP